MLCNPIEERYKMNWKELKICKDLLDDFIKRMEKEFLDAAMNCDYYTIASPGGNDTGGWRKCTSCLHNNFEYGNPICCYKDCPKLR